MGFAALSDGGLRSALVRTMNASGRVLIPHLPPNVQALMLMTA